MLDREHHEIKCDNYLEIFRLGITRVVVKKAAFASGFAVKYLVTSLGRRLHDQRELKAFQKYEAVKAAWLAII